MSPRSEYTRILNEDEEEKQNTVTIPIPNQKANPLELLYEYYIKEVQGDPIPFGRREKASIFFELLGSTAGIYSWPPSWEFAKNKAPWFSYSMVITNPLSNSFFLMKATDDLFNSISIESSYPLILNDLINRKSNSQLFLKYSKMIFGATVCAIPFGVVAYMFPLPNCSTTACIATIVSHSIATNTILHAISWNLILKPEYWYYRLPFLPFEKGYRNLRSRCEPESTKNILITHQEKEIIFQKYRDKMQKFIVRGAQRIVNQYIKKRDTNEGAAIFQSLSQRNARLETFINLSTDNDLDLRMSSHSEIYNFCFKNSIISPIHHFFKERGMGYIGVSCMLIGSIGFVIDPFIALESLGLNTVESVFAGILPSYSMVILSAFYGAAIFNQIYNYLTSWDGELSDKFSLEARLYPKMFALFLLINSYIAIFAHGTADALIQTIFSDAKWDGTRHAFEVICMITLGLLSFVPLIELYGEVVKNYVAKFGEDTPNKSATRLLVKSNLIGHRIQQLKGDVLLDGIGEFPENQQMEMGIDPVELNKDKTEIATLNQKIVLLEETKQAENTSSFWNKKNSVWKNQLFEREEKKNEQKKSVNS